MQKYTLFVYNPNILNSFFEVFLKESANSLNDNDVVKHIFQLTCDDTKLLYTLIYSSTNNKVNDVYSKHSINHL